MFPKVLAITVLLGLSIYFMSLSGGPIKELHPRLAKLEVTTSVQEADAILALWQRQKPGEWKLLLLESLEWDTWLICSYAPLFCLLCWLAADRLGTISLALGTWGHGLAAAQIFAGVCDFVENAGLKRTILAGGASSPWVQITGTASMVKWSLLGLGLLFIIFALLHWIVFGLLIKR